MRHVICPTWPSTRLYSACTLPSCSLDMRQVCVMERVMNQPVRVEQSGGRFVCQIPFVTPFLPWWKCLPQSIYPPVASYSNNVVGIRFHALQEREREQKAAQEDGRQLPGTSEHPRRSARNRNSRQRMLRSPQCISAYIIRPTFCDLFINYYQLPPPLPACFGITQRTYV